VFLYVCGVSIMRPTRVRLSNSLRSMPEAWDAAPRPTVAELRPHPRWAGEIHSTTARYRKLCWPRAPVW